VHNDHPIESCKDDEFGREAFAQKISDTIINHTSERGFVIGIYSAWGTGKTSLLNMIKEKLNKKDEKTIIFNFDPWYFSGQDKLLEQFFYNLASTIEKYNNGKKLLKLLLGIFFISALIVTIYLNADLIAHVLGLAMASIAAIGIDKLLKNMSTLGKVSGVLKKIGKGINKKSYDKFKELNAIDSKNEISALIKKSNKKIIILIDDIDRLTKEEICQVFQLVKGLADFPNTTYILCFDPKIIGYALSDIQGENKVYYSGNLFEGGEVAVQRSNDHKNSQKFLEKIIQYPFFLPEIQRDKFIKYLSKSTDEIVGDFTTQKFKQYYWGQITGRGFFLYFSNIREVNRFLNVFSFDFIALSREVNICDLIVISAIKAKDNTLYNFIKNNKEMFCGSTNIFSEIKTTEMKRLKSLVDNYNEYKNNFIDIDIIEPVLEILFPFFSRIMQWNGSRSSLNSYKASDQEKAECRIADSDIFERFFQLSVPDDQISNATIASIISLQSEPDVLLSSLLKEIKEGKGTELIEKLRKECANIQKKNITIFTSALMLLVDTYMIDELQEGEIFSLKLSTNISFLVRDLFEEHFSKDKIIPALILLYKDKVDGIYIQLDSLIWLSKETGVIDRNGTRIGSAKSQNQDQYKKLEKIVFNNVETQAKNKNIISNNNLGHILYRWKEYSPTKLKAFVKKQIMTDNGLMDLLSGLVSYTYTSREEGKYAEMHKRYIEELIGEEAPIVKRIRKIKEDQDKYSQLNEKAKLAVDAILRRDDNPDGYHGI
jgi:predicted KAP-like P-loop ATPase